MIKCYDFKCPDGHITEEFVTKETRTIRCECGLEAHRIISPTRFNLPGNDPGFPGRYDRWIREHEKAGKLHNSQRNGGQ